MRAPTRDVNSEADPRQNLSLGFIKFDPVVFTEPSCQAKRKRPHTCIWCTMTNLNYTFAKSVWILHLIKQASSMLFSNRFMFLMSETTWREWQLWCRSLWFSLLRKTFITQGTDLNSVGKGGSAREVLPTGLFTLGSLCRMSSIQVLIVELSPVA